MCTSHGVTLAWAPPPALQHRVPCSAGPNMARVHQCHLRAGPSRGHRAVRRLSMDQGDMPKGDTPQFENKMVADAAAALANSVAGTRWKKMTARLAAEADDFTHPTSKPVSWSTSDEGDYVLEVPFVALPGSDEAEMSKYTPTAAYLSALSGFTDDGVPLLKAADRYSSHDWFYILASLPRSQVLQRIRSHLIFNVVWAVACAVVHTGGRGRVRSLSPMLHGLVGGMLGILLAFRLNQSYDRFWEARSLWTQISGNLRDMAVLVSTCLDRNQHRDLITAVLRHLVAYPVALKLYLRGQRRLGDFRNILSKKEVAVLQQSDNWPLALCHSLATTIAPLKEHDQPAWWMMAAPLRELILTIGRCERIVRTPVPLSYVRHTSRFLSIFTLTIPMVLVGNMHPIAVPFATGLACWALFSIEEIGHLIEEPFGAQPEDEDKTERTGVIRPEILPLDRYCDSIRRDLQENYITDKIYNVRDDNNTANATASS